MKEHEVDPHHFLDDVHDIPLDRVAARRRGSARLLARLPGRKLRLHQRRCALCPAGARSDRGRRPFRRSARHPRQRATGPSPTRTAMRLLCERFGIDPTHALLVDDMVQNLAPAKALGMTTVWVDNGSERGNHGYDDAHRRLSRRPMSANGSKRSWGTTNERRPAGDDRARVGRARRDRPGDQGRGPPGGRRGASPRSTAARRGSPRRSAANGSSTSG